ncbi:hypothetical protein D7X12_41415 [Corallococcus sicarius]|uniref:Beta-ketoacyl synthase-like N-terminal domain-containing protein n=1 Tax=Corallococcus sicarius TaxID=2316726 RepID=A0A3A8LYU7_9BACT|nr:hypothetical protein D7X12_41415 [Corallococcus sicarius]
MGGSVGVAGDFVSTRVSYELDLTGPAMTVQTACSWNSGVRLRSRSGWSASTSCSKGTSWCAYASRHVLRTRCSNSPKPRCPAPCTRRGSVLMKNPMSGSTSWRVRPEMGEPMTLSSWPLWRDSSRCMPPKSAMNSVTPCLRHSASSSRPSLGDSACRYTAPRVDCAAGRGRSVGSSSAAGAPAS